MHLSIPCRSKDQAAGTEVGVRGESFEAGEFDG